ncbi:MAG: response regulator [Armatimonadetes bacterium]|nr:response regulator [Armatimonadota bacterium]
MNGRCSDLGHTILVLEDDPHLREVLVATLADEGYEVRGASSADEALELAGERAFHLSITDVRLPGKDGLSYLLEMRRLQPSAKGIVITGYADRDAPSRAILAQADDYIYKPFNLMTLLSSVERVLNPPDERSRELLAEFRPRHSDWIELGRTRDRTYRGFFVGVRSAMLDSTAARRLWNRLEELESERESFWSRLEEAFEPGGEPRDGAAIPDCSGLIRGYETLLQRLTGSVQVAQPSAGKEAQLSESLSEIVQTRPAAPPGPGVEPAVFDRLYRRIREGEVTPEWLILAPALRRLSPERLRDSAELRQAYDSLWT